MSRNRRIALILGAVVVAVLAFVIVSPGNEDDTGEEAARTTPAQTEEEAPPQPEPEPEVHRVQLRGGEVVGGAPDITVTTGDVVRIVVSSDAPDDIHLHGYDVEKEAGPGTPARFRFKADLEGSFEMESHVAEDAGRDPLVARLVVEPS